MELTNCDLGKMIHFSFFTMKFFLPSQKIMIPKHNVRKGKVFSSNWQPNIVYIFNVNQINQWYLSNNDTSRHICFNNTHRKKLFFLFQYNNLFKLKLNYVWKFLYVYKIKLVLSKSICSVKDYVKKYRCLGKVIYQIEDEQLLISATVTI